MSKSPVFYEFTLDSWESAKSLGKILSKDFVFRGQENNNWPLSTSLERALDNELINSLEKPWLWVYEKEFIDQFKTRLHYLIQSQPKENNFLDCLALLQHHGGVTRLLDFTKSFYVASFFAVENASSDSCIWAVNKTQLMSNGLDKLGIELDDSLIFTHKYDTYYQHTELCLQDSTKSPDIVLVAQPNTPNERMAIQKGLFLFPCNYRESFAYNLCKSFDFQFTTLDSKNARQIALGFRDVNRKLYKTETCVAKINLPKIWHHEIIVDLFDMNIDSASLFPGLDGFAKSLKMIIRDLDIFN